mmetsp:Transcript_17831/g.58323  ORF Transcript_17831/g.58323 Transcript_17831/m.58323 type:complete len:332 (+) Transcript_17831:561-1556(+)
MASSLCSAPSAHKDRNESRWWVRASSLASTASGTSQTTAATAWRLHARAAARDSRLPPSSAGRGASRPKSSSERSRTNAAPSKKQTPSARSLTRDRGSSNTYPRRGPATQSDERAFCRFVYQHSRLVAYYCPDQWIILSVVLLAQQSSVDFVYFSSPCLIAALRREVRLLRLCARCLTHPSTLALCRARGLLPRRLLPVSRTLALSLRSDNLVLAVREGAALAVHARAAAFNKVCAELGFVSPLRLLLLHEPLVPVEVDLRCRRLLRTSLALGLRLGGANPPLLRLALLALPRRRRLLRRRLQARAAQPLEHRSHKLVALRADQERHHALL